MPDRVVPPAPPVATLSYSAIAAHAACGYRFYLERVLRLPEQDPPVAVAPGGPAEPGAGIDPRLRGTIVHELLEHVDLAAPNAPAEEAVRRLASAHGAELAAAEVEDILALVRATLASPVLARAAGAPERHAEHAFALALGAEHPRVPLLTGVVDLLAIEDDGGALVVDYKTDRLGGRDPEAVVASDYGIQRSIYALAALRHGAPRVEVAHLFCERPEAPALARHAAPDIPRLEAEIAARAAGVVERVFAVTGEPHRELCATCPGRGGLCSWPDDVVLRQRAAEA